jgi:hypothetical protein
MLLQSPLQNSLFSIQPYWLGRTWAFDAPHLGLYAEPFIAGTNTILTQLAQTYLGIEPKAGASFQLIFSAQPFPGIHLRIQRQNSEFGGYWYVSDEREWGWLCPAMQDFFPDGLPKALYLRVLR